VDPKLGSGAFGRDGGEGDIEFEGAGRTSEPVVAYLISSSKAVSSAHNHGNRSLVLCLEYGFAG
jgi:hypothetical protein